MRPIGARPAFRLTLAVTLALGVAAWAEEAKLPEPPPPPQRVAPRSAGEIAYLFHGAYMNAQGQRIENPSAEMIEKFRSSRPRARAVANPRTQQQYCSDCLAAGVPEPPPLSDSGKWKSMGTLADKFVSEPVIEILVHESTSPPGVCVALPRGQGQNAELVGVICQGRATGKACFWDNVDSQTGQRLTGTVRSLDIARFQNGDQLEEDCTDCHRGENVYLIHDELEKVPSRDPDPGARYQPLPTGAHVTGSSWGNPGRRRADDPGERNLMREDGCGMCHTMPAMSQPYCNSVLAPSLTRNLMPPGDGLASKHRETLLCRDFCLLHYECRLNGYDDSLLATQFYACDCNNRWWPELYDVPQVADPN